MAIIRTASNSIRRGRVGDTTYYYRNGEQVARQARNNANYGAAARRAPAQQQRRVKWANLVNFFRASQFWMKGAFESKSQQQTDYNAFMSRNVGINTICLTKTQARTNACVCGAYVVSSGQLSPLMYDAITQGPSGWVISSSLTLTIGATTTIKALSEALINSGDGWQNGDNLVYVFYLTGQTEAGDPRLDCLYYEFTLDTSNTALVSTLPIYAAFNVGEQGLYAGSGNLPGGAAIGFAAIHVRRGDRLMVSSQTVSLQNTTLVDQFSTPEWEQTCIDSYGEDDDVLIAPN